VWTHTWLSFSPNIFTNLPLVHTLNPDFLGLQLWLCFSPGSRMSSHKTSEPGFQQIPESVILPKFGPSTVEIPGSRMFVTSPLRRIKIPEFCTFANSWLHRFQASENREFLAPEKHALRTLLSLTFRGWRVFLNSPTLAPRGSGLTPTIRFHEPFGNLVKNVTLGTSEGTRVARGAKGG
jgi:hypothetical protein